MKRSKRYNELLKKVDQSKSYSPDEAIKLFSELKDLKFDPSYELHISFQIPKKDQVQPLRGSFVFPHQFGSVAKVLVLAEEEKQADAKKAGADFVGLDDLVKKIESGWGDFDVVIATPKVMPAIAKLGKVLGPKGLMPNPKTGTVTDNLQSAIKTYKSGKVDYKSDDGLNIHVAFGKLSMKPEAVLENLSVVIKEIVKSERSALSTAPKGAFMSTSMGPSVKLDISEYL